MKQITCYKNKSYLTGFQKNRKHKHGGYHGECYQGKTVLPLHTQVPDPQAVTGVLPQL